MSCRTLACDPDILVTSDGDEFTFTLLNCYYTGPELVRDVLTKYICKYMEDNDLYFADPTTGNRLPIILTGSTAVVSGLLSINALLFNGSVLSYDGEQLTYVEV
jgi:hypothetical protein